MACASLPGCPERSGYPAARRGGEGDTLWGRWVPDPYRWMETPSSELDAWLAAQAALADDFCASAPEYAQALAFLTEHTSDTRPPPLAAYPAPDGRHIAAPEHAPNRTVTLSIRDAQSGALIESGIPSSFPLMLAAWSADGRSVAYNAVPAAGQPAGIYLHRTGCPTTTDECIIEQSASDGRFLFPYPAGDGRHFLVHFERFADGTGGWAIAQFHQEPHLRVLVEREFPARLTLVGSTGERAYFATDDGAPNWRIVAVDLANPGGSSRPGLREIIPQSAEPLALSAGVNEGQLLLADGLLYLTFVRTNTHSLRVFGLDGIPRTEVPLPQPCRVDALTPAEGDAASVSIDLQSFLAPPARFLFDSRTGRLQPASERCGKTAPTSWEARLCTFPSRDGTQIPMTLLVSGAAAPDTKRRVLLHGYGGWGVPALPRYDPVVRLWLEWGGIYAVAHVRGGSEFGERWHEAGRLAHKQRSFEDFCAAAEYLVREGWTTPARIAITGATGGGLLVTACAQQRPDLFAAVVAEAALVDPIRFADTPAGDLVTAELGNAHDSPDVLTSLLGYSPLHNVGSMSPGPAFLHVVAEADSRHQPAHVFKHVAALQHARGEGDAPVILGYVREQADSVAVQRAAALKAAFTWVCTEG